MEGYILHKEFDRYVTYRKYVVCVILFCLVLIHLILEFYIIMLVKKKQSILI